MNTDENERLIGLLRQSVEDFAWAVAQMPAALRTQLPPRHPEDWPVDRHVFHLLVYERYIALPSMRQWSDEAPPLQEADVPDEETLWADPALNRDVDALLAELRVVRAAQLDVLARTPATAWDATRLAAWGTVTLRWVLTKTYQHTCEHTHDVLRMVLWWDTPTPTA
jgi:hypothetical protein